MNLYGLPEFAAYSLLVGIACVLIQQRRSYTLGYWLAGWVLILIHAGVYMLLPAIPPFDLIGRATLALAGQSFILAAYCQHEPTPRGRHVLIPAAFSGTLGLVFQLVATATDNASAAPWWFYALIASGAIFTLWLVTVDRTADRRGRSLAAVLIVATYALQAALLVHYGPLMAGQWLMCWTYLAAGFLFVRQTPKLSIGVAFTALSFALWGLVFPVYTLLNIYYPTVSAHIEDGVWNLPKFLAAASMILMLLERRIASVTHLATHDELTGLANRRLYARSSTETIARARRAGCRFVLIVIDLNGFKEINDTMGHQAGDELLQEVATRLGAVVRHTDTLARTGGDEFTAILDQIGDVTQVDHITAAITGSVLEPVTIQGKTCFVTASIGVAVYPTDGTTIADLTAVADQRMYRHKDEYRAQLLRDD